MLLASWAKCTILVELFVRIERPALLFVHIRELGWLLRTSDHSFNGLTRGPMQVIADRIVHALVHAVQIRTTLYSGPRSLVRYTNVQTAGPGSVVRQPTY